MQVRLTLIDSLPEIIAASVKPIENIDGIKILHVDGLGVGGGANGAAPDGGAGLSDQIVNSALRYRAQAPLLDAMLKEIGLQGGDVSALSEALNSAAGVPETKSDG